MVQLSPQIAPAITAIWFTSHRKLLRLSPQIGSAITAKWFNYCHIMVQLSPQIASAITAKKDNYHKGVYTRVHTHTHAHTQTHIHMHSHMHAHKKDLYMGTTYRFNGKTNCYIELLRVAAINEWRTNGEKNPMKILFVRKNGRVFRWFQIRPRTKTVVFFRPENVICRDLFVRKQFSIGKILLHPIFLVEDNEK